MSLTLWMLLCMQSCQVVSPIIIPIMFLKGRESDFLKANGFGWRQGRVTETCYLLVNHQGVHALFCPLPFFRVTKL